MPKVNLADPGFDTLDIRVRDAVLLDVLRQQLAFLHDEVPFWSARLDKAGVDVRRIESPRGPRSHPDFHESRTPQCSPA
ncbi:hypothetical protein WPS_08340 [Vulcanimicrobium alpinum]|uniref:Uncharacterized protein n=1 Tax=Vulcanimicrobium alpinum TaxID=3016050 RepID=A0AAN1XWG7_UNVUL|nr:hypothetical protein WPS_08340 [Vulcanimicrobium alpinum]